MPGEAGFVKASDHDYNPRVLPSPCHIVSDAHLGVAAHDSERLLLTFLRHVGTAGGSLVVNGDLFEFWFEWRHVIPRTGFRVLAALADLRDAGVPVVMIGGNHDCWGGEVLRQDVGVEFVLGAWEGELAGWRARIEHGDGLRPREDRGYRALRRVLRHPWSIAAFRLIHPDLGSRLALGSSHASRTYTPRDGGRGLRDAAESHLSASPSTELLVYGHSHVPSLERLPAGGIYANAGAWLSAPTYLRVTPERIALRSWDSAEGVDLHAIDRVPQEALP
jgi:UDP-2,3-diacylglucosamine hydrolase